MQEIEERAEAAVERAEDGHARAKELGDDIAKLKNEHAELSEKRRELWREETKLMSLVDTEADELKSTEWSLASMMDKASSQYFGATMCSRPLRILMLNCVHIAECLGLDGVYGPLN